METVLPITREAFQEVVEAACLKAEVPYTEDSIIAAINYFHSLDRDIHWYDPQILSNYLRRAYSNQMTFDYTTEIRHKREQERLDSIKDLKEPALGLVAQSQEH